MAHTHTHTHNLMFWLYNSSKCTRCNTRSIFKRSLTGFTIEFSFSNTGCHTEIKEPRLSYYLLRVGGTIIGFIPFLRVLALYEIQTVSFMFELGSWCPFPTSITIIQGAAPFVAHTYTHTHSHTHTHSLSLSLSLSLSHTHTHTYIYIYIRVDRYISRSRFD